MSIRLPSLLLSGALALVIVTAPASRAEAGLFGWLFGCGTGYSPYSTYYGGPYAYGGPYTSHYAGYYGSSYSSYYAPSWDYGYSSYYAPAYSSYGPGPCCPTSCCPTSCCPTGCGIGGCNTGCGISGCGPAGCPSGNCTLNYPAREPAANSPSPTPVDPNKTYREDPMGEEPPVPEDGFGPRQTDPMTPDESENFQPPTSREPNPPVPVTPKGNPLDGENSVNGTFSAEVKQDELAPLGLDEKLTVTASSERIERMYLKASFHSPTVERKAIALKTPWAPQTQKIAGLNSK